MALTQPIPLKLYDDPIAGYNELSSALPAGEKYKQDFDFATAENPKSIYPRYLEDIYPNAKVTDADGNLDSWAISQLEIGACGTFAQIASLSSIPSDNEYAIEKGIYPLTPSPIGLYMVRICDPANPMGTKWMAIDSRMPCNSATGGSAFISAGAQNALLPALMTKAAATAKGGCFDEITNSAKLKLSFSWFPEVTFKCDDFAKFKEALSYGGICITAMTQQYDANGVAITPAGVVYGHAFSLADYIENDGYQLVRIENPWGGGSDYLSLYAENAEFWTAHPELAAKQADAKASGGNYWVDWATLKALTGKTSFDVSVPVPNPKFPHIQYFRQELNSDPVLGTDWWNWTKQIFDRTPTDRVHRITLEAATELQVETSWVSGSGARHTSVKILDATGKQIAATPEAFWGGKGVSTVTLPAGTYGFYPLTRNYNTDKGLLQVRVYSSAGGWQLA